MFEKPKRQFSASPGILLTRQLSCAGRLLVVDLPCWHSDCYRALLVLCFARFVYADFDFRHFLASHQSQTMCLSKSLADELLIVVPFSLFASTFSPVFPVRYSPSTQNEQCVVQNRALDHRLLSDANWCRTPRSDVVHSARSQDMSNRLRIQGISDSASPGAVWRRPLRRTPCSVLPPLTSTAIPSSS